MRDLDIVLVRVLSFLQQKQKHRKNDLYNTPHKRSEIGPYKTV